MSETLTESAHETMGTLSDNIGDMEFSKEEKQRLVALVLARDFYCKLIINDAEYLRVMLKNDQPVRAATIDSLMAYADRMYNFIKGGGKDADSKTTEQGAQS